MKLITLLLFFSLVSSRSVPDHTIDLYDSSGNAVAYIDDYVSDRVIYFWDGKPVAYLYQSFTGTDVFGFNGKHLGWFEDGKLRDNDGYLIAATKEAIGRITYGETLKGVKDTPPEKKYHEQAPVKPYFSDAWSTGTLRDYLLQGIDN